MRKKVSTSCWVATVSVICCEDTGCEAKALLMANMLIESTPRMLAWA